jgi:hypothetical protein
MATREGEWPLSGARHHLSEPGCCVAVRVGEGEGQAAERPARSVGHHPAGEDVVCRDVLRDRAAWPDAIRIVEMVTASVIAELELHILTSVVAKRDGEQVRARTAATGRGQEDPNDGERE